MLFLIWIDCVVVRLKLTLRMGNCVCRSYEVKSITMEKSISVFEGE